MRERWARWLAALTGLLVLLLAVGFARLQNPSPPDAPAAASTAHQPASAVDPDAAAEPGRALFDVHGCARCHSIAGHGSPRSPLDGVGADLSREELRQWIVADAAIADDLSARTRAAKAAYAELPEAELQALVDYLYSLR